MLIVRLAMHAARQQLSRSSTAFTSRKYEFLDSVDFYMASAVAASPVLATIGMSVRPSVCHTLALSENDAS